MLWLRRGRLRFKSVMGIEAIWLIYPRKSIYRRYHQGKLIEAGSWLVKQQVLRLRRRMTARKATVSPLSRSSACGRG